MALQWDDRYSLGHERIDAEHRIFLDLIVEFDALAAHGAPNDKLVRTLKEICKYAEFHFLSEENLMIDCRYPELEQHCQLHQQLISALDDHLHRLLHRSTTPGRVFEFLFQWFALHTSSEDKKLVSYIAQQRS